MPTLESILIVGYKRPGAIENAYRQAFDRLGLPVDHFDLEPPHPWLFCNRLINRLTQGIQSELVGRSFFQYIQARGSHYTIIIVFKGMQLSPTWLARCKATVPRATWININPDDPFNSNSRGSTNQNVQKTIGLYDLYATWGNHLVSQIQAAGCPAVLLLPFAYSIDWHFPANALIAELADIITFVGCWDKHREQILTEIADFPLRIYGYGWHRIGHRSPLRNKIYPVNLYGEDLRQVVSSSKVSLNILRSQNYKAHNMRTFEIPAMRGLMVTTHSDDQNQFFPDGQACLMYYNSLDLQSKLRQIIKKNFDISRMKEEAFNLCRGHSYDDRAFHLLETLTFYRQTGKTP